MSLRFKNRSRKLRIEQFEARQMMAGDFGAFGAVDPGVVSDSIAPPPDTSGYMSTAYELNLNSLKGAPATLFLDFNGHFQSGTVREVGWDVWNAKSWSKFMTPAYDIDGDRTTFSPKEQQNIQSIWALVAEDFAPFNINVTTVDPDPGNLHPERPYLRVVVSGDADFRGQGAMGFSYVDAYADNHGAAIAYAFSRGNGKIYAPRLIGETISHEAGHAFGLEHRDSNAGSSTRIPIMGEMTSESAAKTAYESAPGQWVYPWREVWWDGDMGVIASSDNGFGYRADDHSNFFSGASGMVTSNVGLFARGVIGKTNDVDMFRFDTGGGAVSIQLNVAQDANMLHIANLDSEILLYNSNGALIAFGAPTYALDANISTTLAAGTYFVSVGSRGQYGDVGQYTLTMKENTGAHIVSSQFQTLSSLQMGLTVTFNEAINWITFTPADIRINGGLPGAGVVSVQRLADPKQFLIIINAVSNTSPSVAIGPDILDLFGNRMDQNKNGLNGEASDYYLASPFKFGLNEVKTPTTTTRPRTRMLSTTAVDAYYTTY